MHAAAAWPASPGGSKRKRAALRDGSTARRDDTAGPADTNAGSEDSEVDSWALQRCSKRATVEAVSDGLSLVLRLGASSMSSSGSSSADAVSEMDTDENAACENAAPCAALPPGLQWPPRRAVTVPWHGGLAQQHQHQQQQHGAPDVAFAPVAQAIGGGATPRGFAWGAHGQHQQQHQQQQQQQQQQQHEARCQSQHPQQHYPQQHHPQQHHPQQRQQVYSQRHHPREPLMQQKSPPQSQAAGGTAARAAPAAACSPRRVGGSRSEAAAGARAHPGDLRKALLLRSLLHRTEELLGRGEEGQQVNSSNGSSMGHAATAARQTGPQSRGPLPHRRSLERHHHPQHLQSGPHRSPRNHWQQQAATNGSPRDQQQQQRPKSSAGAHDLPRERLERVRAKALLAAAAAPAPETSVVGTSPRRCSPRLSGRSGSSGGGGGGSERRGASHAWQLAATRLAGAPGPRRG